MKSTIIKHLKIYKDSINWTYFLTVLIIFNFVVILDWSLISFLTLNGIFLLVSIVIYIERLCLCKSGNKQVIDEEEKTELQKEFEAQTPTIKGIYGNEYNLVYCAWLEHQVEKLRKESK